jgi:large subunit ribosomal protein L18
MNSVKVKLIRRIRRKTGIRKRVYGSGERPRLTVFRSVKHIYAQIIDDQRGLTLCEASTKSKALRTAVAKTGDIAAAKVVGAELAKRALSKQISKVAFDRNGYKFHGRVKGLADAAREAGLQF